MHADFERGKSSLATCQDELGKSLAVAKSLESHNGSLQAQLLAAKDGLGRSREELARALEDKESLLSEISELQHQQNSITERLKSLQLEIDNANREGATLAFSLSKSNQALQSSEQGLTEMRKQHLQLSSQMLALQQQLSVLESSVQRCWWHRIQAWVRRPEAGRLSPSPSPEGSTEQRGVHLDCMHLNSS